MADKWKRFKERFVTTPEEAHKAQIESNPEQAKIEQTQIDMAKRAAPDQNIVTQSIKKVINPDFSNISKAGLGLAMTSFLNNFFPVDENKTEKEEVEQDRDIKNFGFGS